MEDGDVVVVLPHRGTKSYTVQSAVAAVAGAVTVGITGKGSPWSAGLTHRLESREPDTGAYQVHDLDFGLIVRWIDAPAPASGLLDAWVRAALKAARLSSRRPTFILGDLERQCGWPVRFP